MYKLKLRELCQKRKYTTPAYEICKQGLDHNPCFLSTVVVGYVSFSSPSFFKSKKLAEKDAARLAYDHFILLPPAPVPSLLIQSAPEELELKEQHLKSLETIQKTFGSIKKTPQERLDTHFEAIDKELSGLRSALKYVSNYSEKKKAERRDFLSNSDAVSTSLSMDQPPCSPINKRPRMELDTTSDMPLSS